MKQIFTFTLLILAIGLAAFEYDVIDELPMGNVYGGVFGTVVEYPHVFVSSRYGLQVLEIDPSDGSFSEVSLLAIPGEAVSLVKLGSYVYVLRFYSSCIPYIEQCVIYKIDVSSPETPAIVDSRQINADYHPLRLYTLGSAIAFENQYPWDCYSISLIDPETLQTIAEVDDYSGFSKIDDAVAITLVDPDESLYTLYDFSDPGNVIEIGSVVLDATDSVGGRFYRWDDTHVVHMFYGELIMYEVTDLTEWIPMSTIQFFSLWFDRNPLRYEDRLLLTTTATIQVVDFSDMENPIYIENFTPPPEYWYPVFASSSLFSWSDYMYWQTAYNGILQMEMQPSGLAIADAFCPKYPLYYCPVKFDDTLISVSTGKGVDTFSIDEDGIDYLQKIFPEYEISWAFQWNNDVIMLDFVQDTDRHLGFFHYENAGLSPIAIHPINNFCYPIRNDEEPDIVYLYNAVTTVISRCLITESYDMEYLYQYTLNHDSMFGLQFHDSYLYGLSDLYNLCVIGGLTDNAGYEEAYLEHPFGEDGSFTHWILDDLLVIAYEDSQTPNRLYTFNGPSDFEYHADEQYYMDGLPPSRKGDYLYLPGWYSLHVYYITDYDNPVHLGYIPLNSHYQDIVFYEENGVEKAIIQQAECLTMVTIQPTEAGEPTLPVVECTLGNYPNPFKPAAAGRGPATEIRFQLSDVRQFERTQIEIFNIRGQKVKELKADMSSRPIRQLPERGEISYSTTWDGTDSNGTPVAGGVYLYQLKADGKALGQSKMLLLK
jgi:hypothetical protein